ncbi:MAG TPA: DEAD/DEAH box helicase [Nocardioidaceae bacterium]|nr:DEAD/DEAH box helicase [Nocardioidaceae bacterium]
MSAVAEFARGYDFPLDAFQLAACAALAAGRGVLVAAPTGAGKTVVGEFAVHLAVTGGGKCFYTTPIKALSNQKYADLSRRYGAGTVGLLTGDNSINGEAPVVVMTTEVLRNMLFAASGTLSGLGYVVMDEVHYLADRSRGPVWEEVIINLPESVALVSLSATVSNAEEFGDWLRTVRGELDVIVEEHRPVPLFQHVLAGERLYDLYADPAGAPPKVNPELTRLAHEDWQRWRGRGGGHRGGYRGRRSRDLVPSRVELVDTLDEAALLPAIIFIFSRAGCDAAVQQCLNTNLRLVTDDERRAVREVMDRRLGGIADADLDALGYDEWAAALQLGVASHHAGLLPAFKECVEELFAAGLVKVVFATETLALGINMPARTVAIERMTKWNGETHAEVTPGEYTQLTGRAGRRGIDVEGHAVVVWSPGLEPAEVAGLASTRTYPLRSSFRPSYNMAVNLVRQSGLEVARELLESSFAQFQADRAVVGLAAELHRVEERLAGARERVACECGDVVEYAGLLRELSERESEAARQRRAGRRDDVAAALRRLGPGDVIWVPAGRRKGYGLVVDPGHRSAGDHASPLVVTLDRRARRLAAADLPAAPTTLGRLRVPRTVTARSPQQRRDLAARLREFVRDAEAPSPGPTPEPGDGEVQRLRAAIRAHPSHACPHRDGHVKASTELLRLERDVEALRRRIETRTNTIARQFDRVCELLSALGYLADGAVTTDGVMLAGIYGELDLVVAECLRRGTWSGLDAPGLAAVLSCVVFESRAPDEGRRPRLPAGPARTAIEDTVRVWADLDRLERAHRLSQLREPDPGFAWGAHRWAAGEPLERALEDAGLPAGDFVRWVKQVIDVAGQVGAVAPDESIRRVARDVVEAMRRGVAAY